MGRPRGDSRAGEKERGEREREERERERGREGAKVVTD